MHIKDMKIGNRELLGEIQHSVDGNSANRVLPQRRPSAQWVMESVEVPAGLKVDMYRIVMLVSNV